MKKIIILYNIIIFFTLSCNNDKNEDYNNHEYIGIKISPPQKNITKKASDLYDVIKYIPLETNDDCIIGNVKKIIVNKNIFYILDPISKAIFCFNESGRFKFKIHSVGRGPEDYKSIDDFSIHDDYIYLLDVSLKKILKYNLNGKLTNIIKHEIYASQMEILPNKKSVFYCDFSANPLTIEKKENFNFLITSFEKNLKITKKLLPFSNNIDTGNLIGKARNIFRHNDTLTIWESFDNKIYHFVNDRFFPAYKLNFTNENEKIAAKILDDVINKNNGGQQTLKQMKELGYCEVIDIIETDDNLVITYFQNDFYHFLFYDKKTKKSINLAKKQSNDNLSPIPIENDFDGSLYYHIYTAQNDTLYSSLDSYELKNSEKMNPLLSKHINKIEEANNPVMVLFKIKDFINEDTIN